MPSVQRAELETAEEDVTVEYLGVALVRLAGKPGGDPDDPARGVVAQRDLRIFNGWRRLPRLSDLLGEEILGFLPGGGDEPPAPTLSVLVVNDPAVSIPALPHAGHVSALAGVAVYGAMSPSPA
jgi:hypothetical protein